MPGKKLLVPEKLKKQRYAQLDYALDFRIIILFGIGLIDVFEVAGEYSNFWES